jgi:hypothetical protein
MSCLLGTDPLAQKECVATPSVVDAYWTISESGRIIASGDSSDPAGGNDGYRLLGAFRPSDEGPYVLELTVRRDGTALDIAHRRLNVVLDLFEADGRRLRTITIVRGGRCRSTHSDGVPDHPNQQTARNANEDTLKAILL